MCCVGGHPEQENTAPAWLLPPGKCFLLSPRSMGTTLHRLRKAVWSYCQFLCSINLLLPLPVPAPKKESCSGALLVKLPPGGWCLRRSGGNMALTIRVTVYRYYDSSLAVDSKATWERKVPPPTPIICTRHSSGWGQGGVIKVTMLDP